jgi:hypothetical protein
VLRLHCQVVDNLTGRPCTLREDRSGEHFAVASAGSGWLASSHCPGAFPRAVSAVPFSLFAASSNAFSDPRQNVRPAPQVPRLEHAPTCPEDRGVDTNVTDAWNKGNRAKVDATGDRDLPL